MHVLSGGRSLMGILGSPARNCCDMVEGVRFVCAFCGEIGELN